MISLITQSAYIVYARLSVFMHASSRAGAVRVFMLPHLLVRLVASAVVVMVVMVTLVAAIAMAHGGSFD